MSETTIQARDAFERWRSEVRQNFFDGDPHLASLMAHYGRESAQSALHKFGEDCLRIDALAHENNRDEHLPRLRRWDDQGRRRESVDFHESYHRIGRLIYRSGVMERYREPGREWETMALVYLSGMNGEAGHNCPLACTAGLIKILGRRGDEHAEWLSKLTDPDYDTHFHGAQFLTEVQGGSDVGRNSLEARPGDGPGHVRLYGEKWFCSVVDAHLMLVTARPEGAPPGTGGVRAYVVPRHLEDGSLNDFEIRRLKFKLGTKSMASGEVDFMGARAVEVGDFKDTVSIVLNTSRLYNAMVGAGCIERAYREAHAYARHRLAFGQPILDFPAVARIVARLRSEAYAARSLGFLLADLSDRMAIGEASEEERDAFRMLVNLNKFWVSVVGTSALRDAIEVLGGNGAIEEFSVLPRLLRDSIVCEQWEGPHNVLCAQVLRDSKQRGLGKPMLSYLASLAGEDDPDFVALRALWERLDGMPLEQATVHVRDIVERIRPHAQALALSRESRSEGSCPLLPTVIEHHRRVNADPLDDAGLMERVRRLTL